MNIITCNLMQDSGSVFWNGKNIHHRQERFFSVLGYMPQQQGLYPGFTGRRFLEYFAALKEIPQREISAEAERVAAEVNLSQELDKQISAYSGGMKPAAARRAGADRQPAAADSGRADPRGSTPRTGAAAGADGKTCKRADRPDRHPCRLDVESVADGILLLRRGELADIGSPQELIGKYLPGGTLEEVYLAVFGDEEAQ